MVLTRQEKEGWVIKLSNEGKTIRDIVEIVHMSFGDISSIIRRETREDVGQNRIRLSKASQALQLFEQGNTPIDVAIKLDIEPSEAGRLYKEFWNLKGLHNLRQVYAEIRDDISSFLKLYQLTKKLDLGSEKVENLLNLSVELPYLERKYVSMKKNVSAFKFQQDKLEKELYRLNRFREISANMLRHLQEQKNKLQRLIDRLKNTEEYYKINKLVEKKVREILDNKKLIIRIALSSVLMAIRNEPDKHLINRLLGEEMDSATNEFHRQKISELTQTCYDQLIDDGVDSILNSVIFESEA